MVISQLIIQWINPLLIAMFILLMYQGYKKGFVSKLLSLLSFFVIVIVAWNVAPAFGYVFKILPKSLAPYQETPLADFFYSYINQILIFVVIVIIASLLIFLLKPIAELFTKVPGISFINATLGAFLGVVEMTLLSFVLLFVLHSPVISNGENVINQTYFKYFDSLQQKVITIGADVLSDFNVLSDSINHEENAMGLKNFLIKHGYSDEVVQEFIEQIGG